MKQVIDGKLYNTETATLLHEWDNGIYDSDFRYVDEALYVSKKAQYFIAGRGGAMTDYKKAAGQNSWSGGRKIWTLDRPAAIKWLEEHNGTDALETHFADAIAEG